MHPSRHPGIQHTLEQGLYYLQSGRSDLAEPLFRQALSLDKKNLNTLQMLGVLLSQTNRLAEGEQLLRKAIKLNNKIAQLHFNLGNNLEAQNKTKEAIGPLRMAVELDKTNEWHHSGLGLAYLKLGRYEEAVASLRQGLKRNPDNTTLLTNLGNALWRAGAKDEGIDCLKRALELDPDMLEANTILGAFYFERHEIDKAEELLRRALAKNPRHFEAMNNLAGVLLHQLQRGDIKDSQESVDICRRLVAIGPDIPDLHQKLARALEEADEHQLAVKALEEVLRLEPDNLEARMRLSRLQMVLGNFDQAGEQARAALEQKDKAEGAYHTLLESSAAELTPQDLDRIETILQDHWDKGQDSGLFFSFARYLEKQKDYARAFTHLERGNQLKRKTFTYDSAEETAYFERIKARYNSDFFAQRQGYGFAQPGPILILGMPRSGSTLTEQIIASHPQVFGAGELGSFSRLLHEKAASVEDASKLSAEDFRAIGEAYWQELQLRATASAPYVTDKGLGNFQHLGAIYAALPQAKIIHIHRNPMDNCYAIYKQDFAALFHYAYDLTELGQYHRLYQDLMAHWHQVLPQGYIFDCSYEALVADQEGMTRQLLEFCGLPWDDACLEFYKTKRAVQTASLSQVRKKIYTSSVALWENYREQLEPLRQALEPPRM